MILAIDQGTTGTTALLVDERGAIVDREYRELPQHYPQPGWVEHDPGDIMRGVSESIEALASRAGSPIRALGIVNQRESVLLWDRKTGEPVHRVIVWQDRRTADICRELKPHEPLFRQCTGLFLDPYFSGTKLTWLLREHPELQPRAAAGDLLAGTIDTWLIWNLTGGKVHATDPTNASRTLLYNLHTQDWDDELLKHLEVPRAVLPEVRPSRGHFGECTLPALKGVPIGGVAGDQQAALFGQGCTEPGLVKNTYGTGCFVLSILPELSIPKEPVLVTAAATGRGEAAYALEGSIFIAGAVVQWLRDELGLIEHASESEALAESVPDTHGVHLVPAFAGLGAPYWDADARGAVLGLSRGVGRAHLVRAALEGIAFQTADLMDAVGLLPQTDELRVDGGACQNNFLMQFQADLLGIPVNRPADIETTALGAAYLAGLSTGVWNDPSEVQHLRKTERIFEPKMRDTERAERLAAWREAVARIRSRSE